MPVAERTAPTYVEAACRIGRQRILQIRRLSRMMIADDRRLEEERDPPADRGRDQAADQRSGCGPDATHPLITPNARARDWTSV